MVAPKAPVKGYLQHPLVDLFERNLRAFKQGPYNEAQARSEFIDPFFKALGWDMTNEQGYSQTYKAAALPGGGICGTVLPEREPSDMAQDVARKLIESYAEHGDPLPSKIVAAFGQPQRRTKTKIDVGLSFEPALA